ncbi:MAG: DUF2057 domain-containing protein [Gammaproteobacteria bacterium]|nr:DUF2057 domain-containing protein [Gammaproteobacteria bacterium]
MMSACASNKPIILYSKNPENITDVITLTMPIEIDVVYHDGKREAFMPGYQEFISYKLLPGKHLLGFKYQDMVTDAEGNNESIKSRTVMIRFDGKPGEKYNIDFTPPKTAEEALPLEKTLELTLSNQKRIIATSYPAPEAPTANWFSTKPFDPETAELFESNNMENSALNPPAKNATNTQHLRYWWMMASPEEKSDFKSWLTTH